MAFPTVESVTETAFASGTAHNVSMPATVNSGDLLVVLFTNDGNATVTTPSGWTLIDSTANGTQARLSTYYRIADGSEDGTTVDFVTSADESAAAQTYRISGWHGTTPPEIGTPATGTDANPNPSSTTPSWGAEDNLWIAVAGWDRDRTVTTYPTNYSSNNTDTVSGAGAGGSGVGSGTRNLNGTTDDPGTFTLNASEEWISYTIVVRPSGSSDRRLRVSFAEMEVPNAPRRLRFSWAEMEVPNAPRRLYVSFAEMEVPTAPRRLQVSFAEMEVPTAPRRLLVSWSEMEVPNAPRRLYVSWAEMEVPDVVAADRRLYVSFAEMEVPTAPRRLYVSFAEMEVPTAPRRLQVSFAEMEIPNADRRLWVSFAEMEVPNAPRRLYVSWVELEVPTLVESEIRHLELRLDGDYLTDGRLYIVNPKLRRSFLQTDSLSSIFQSPAELEAHPDIWAAVATVWANRATYASVALLKAAMNAALTAAGYTGPGGVPL